MDNFKQIKNTRMFVKGDIFVYIVLVVVIAVVLTFVLVSQQPGGKVEVYYDNKLLAEYDLGEDGRHNIAEHMYLVIQNKIVWVEEADCPDKVCMSKKISRSNDPIYCLPNQIAVVIVSNGSDDPFSPDN